MRYLAFSAPESGDVDLRAEVLLGEETFRKASFAIGMEEIDPTVPKDPASNRSSSLIPDAKAAAARAKIAYCESILTSALDLQTSAIAMFSPVRDKRDQDENYLSKDYAYLIERFYKFLIHVDETSMGLLVLPHRERGITDVKVDALTNYFAKSENGRRRARRVVPEPLYVNEGLRAVSHLAEIFSYVAAWGMRLPGMQELWRPELSDVLKCCSAMRFSYLAENGKKDWSFKFIPNLQPSTLARNRTRPAVR